MSVKEEARRTARFRVKYLSVLSVLWTSLATGIAFFFGWMAASYVLFNALDATGVFVSVTEAGSTVFGESAPRIAESGVFYVFTSEFFYPRAAVLGLILVVAFAVGAMVFTLAYNASAWLGGGFRVTLEERPRHPLRHPFRKE